MHQSLIEIHVSSFTGQEYSRLQDNVDYGLLSAGVAIVVRKLQRKWRASTRAFLILRRKAAKAARTGVVCPALSEILADKEGHIAALQLSMTNDGDERTLARYGFVPLRGLVLNFTKARPASPESRPVRLLSSSIQALADTTSGIE